MKYDIILAGVGGQGVLSVSAIIASSAMNEGLFVKQSEVHGMSQRGGAVLANLRLSDQPIASDLIPEGSAQMILSMEPMESLRYVKYLSESGTLIASSNPVTNISNYPDLESILSAIRELPHSVIVDSEKLAREAGSARASNMVIVGAASHHLPVRESTIEALIGEMFARKGEKVVDINLKAFRLGREHGQ
ncbi:MAG TPA: indolepyruvate oxidoreductase subunit beta [Thermoanaerobaculia bacterium]|nr:indolepyruvate oxidoreductase subunit beta [Thermoanaerobaculia bacterium]HUM29191.1 indolepyruvate oxidoreductase subunit beta [Thermoanaerobaculia bacterium]HXK67570.1 indolepyruvate oxidoreductase subunit beta [Thermoanaerobaculia bacterium]